MRLPTADLDDPLLAQLLVHHSYCVVTGGDEVAAVDRLHLEIAECLASLDPEARQRLTLRTTQYKSHYKRMGHKERLQIRAVGPLVPLENEECEFHRLFSLTRRAEVLMESIAWRTLLPVLQHIEFPDADAFLGAHAEPRAESVPSDHLSNSVLNFYNYFNTAEFRTAAHDDGTHYQANCNEHFDPGFVTVLGRATRAGLEVRDAQSNTFTLVEPLLPAQPCVTVIIGETIQRASGKHAPACYHRVCAAERERSNLIFELRPKVPLWKKWRE